MTDNNDKIGPFSFSRRTFLQAVGSAAGQPLLPGGTKEIIAKLMEDSVGSKPSVSQVLGKILDSLQEISTSMGTINKMSMIRLEELDSFSSKEGILRLGSRMNTNFAMLSAANAKFEAAAADYREMLEHTDLGAIIKFEHDIICELFQSGVEEIRTLEEHGINTSHSFPPNISQRFRKKDNPSLEDLHSRDDDSVIFLQALMDLSGDYYKAEYQDAIRRSYDKLNDLEVDMVKQNEVQRKAILEDIGLSREAWMSFRYMGKSIRGFCTMGPSESISVDEALRKPGILQQNVSDNLGGFIEHCLWVPDETSAQLRGMLQSAGEYLANPEAAEEFLAQDAEIQGEAEEMSRLQRSERENVTQYSEGKSVNSTLQETPSGKPPNLTNDSKEMMDALIYGPQQGLYTKLLERRFANESGMAR